MEESATPNALDVLSNIPATGTSEQPDSTQNHQQDKFANRFAALSKKEKELRMMEQQFNEKMKGIKEHENDLNEYREQKKLRETDPMAWLEKNNLSYEKLTEKVMEAPDYQQNAQWRAIQKEIGSLREMIDGFKGEFGGFKESITKKEQEQQQKAQEENHQAYLSHVEQFLESRPDDFELIRTFGDPSFFVEMQQQYYNKNGTVCEVEKLAEAYEKHLEDEQLDKQYKKMKSLKKFKEKYGDDPWTPEQADMGLPQMNTRNPNKTLNRNFSTATPSTSNTDRFLSKEESMARAAQLIRFLPE